jgi:ABC-type dipeptide/oligopeptide/nickel transport system permease subunit
VSRDRIQRLLLLASAIAVFATLAALVFIGLRIPDRFATDVWTAHYFHGAIPQPPFLAGSTLEVSSDRSPQLRELHFYVFGSDAGGRDLLAVTARAVVPSLELVVLALIARMVLGVGAGFLIAAGTEPLRTIARSAGTWIAGFPYLALAVLVIQSFTGGPSTVAVPGRTRFIGFVVAIAVVGWRDVAELVASRMQWVDAQPFALGARALGSSGLGLFRRHVWPYLRQALTIELSFQASAVLVLLAELGFLQYYLGGFLQLFEGAQPGRVAPSFQLAISPELGQMMSDVRLYLLRQEFAPALVPALTLALAALSFELLGRALRGRTDLPT